MYLKSYRASSPSLRFKCKFKLKYVTKFKVLCRRLITRAGRNVTGHIVVYHRRNKVRPIIKYMAALVYIWVPGQLIHIIQDPFRSANVGLIRYINGLYSYILLPTGLEIGQWINQTQRVGDVHGSIKLLAKLPLGQQIYNITEQLRDGQKYVRAAGCCAKIVKQLQLATVLKMPSGQFKVFKWGAFACVGRVSKRFNYKAVLGKAGLMKYLGYRPVVRGTAMNAVDHPHGGQSGPSRSSVTPWGKPTK